MLKSATLKLHCGGKDKIYFIKTEKIIFMNSYVQTPQTFLDGSIRSNANYMFTKLSYLTEV